MVSYNQEENVIISDDAFYDAIIADKEQRATYIMQDGQLISWAFDNKNGNLTVETHPKFQRRGYAEKCINRLIIEYDELGKKLYHNTLKSNIASRNLALKCGMLQYSEGIWIRIDKCIGNEFYENNNELF